MKQTQSRGLKWVSLLLLAAILTTTTPFSAAAENVHTALSDGDTLSAAAQAPAEDSAPLPHPDPAETETEQKETAAISESPDLSSLLFRLNEYDTFTAEEKSAVRSFFGMENDEEQMRLAASQETNIQAALDALSEPRRTEAKIANMAEKGKSFAGLTISERSVITEYLRRSADELAPVFSALEAQGYDLFACTLIAQITEDGLFTLSEAVTLYQMYDGRIERDQNLLAFRSFAKAFTTAEDTLLSKDKTSALRTEKQALRESKAAYISAEALKAAKQLLLNGYTASEIRAAYSVAAAFDLDPADLILSKASVPQDGEGQALLKMYPVALEPVKKALARRTDRAAKNAGGACRNRPAANGRSPCRRLRGGGQTGFHRRICPVQFRRDGAAGGARARKRPTAFRRENQRQRTSGAEYGRAELYRTAAVRSGDQPNVF